MPSSSPYRARKQGAMLLGCCVGGTTTINSGTCIRTPGRILRQWQAEGLSMLQSVVPAALARGASLISGARATRLLRKGDQVQGVCIVGEDGRERQVHARSTVLAMGSLLTPAFLQAQGVRLPWLGRNLSVHPAGAVSAWFPGESFGNSQVIPQGFGVSDLAEAGILFEGATPPLPAQGTLTLTLSGPIYAFRIFRPGQPTLECTGHKTYAIQRLRVSLTTCPLQVREQDRLVGGAELVYRDALWRFPLKCMRIG